MINLNLKKFIFGVVISLLCFIIAFMIAFNLSYDTKYLKECGYSIKDIPKTIAVSLNLSKGFIIGKNEYGGTIFIGDEEYEIYENMLTEMGYYEIYRMGLLGFYSENINDEFEQSDFTIMNSGYYHWFRVYEISNETILNECLN